MYENKQKLRPMSLGLALLYFGVPAALITLNIYIVMPAAAQAGLPIFWNYMLVYGMLPMILLIAASVIVFRTEGHAMTWAAFHKRMRLRSPNGRVWLWGLGLFLVMLVTVGVLRFTEPALVTLPLFSPPPVWPLELNPAEYAPTPGSIPTVFMEQTLKGNWPVFFAVLIGLVVATLGEELWWRGIVLPRQELAHGKFTWIIHGVLWTLFHLFTPWKLIMLLPGALALSYVAQRTKSTIPGIIAHAAVNGLEVLILLIFGVLGLAA